MNQKHVVAVALVWTGLLVVLSRGWLGNVRDYVNQATGKSGTVAS